MNEESDRDFDFDSETNDVEPPEFLKTDEELPNTNSDKSKGIKKRVIIEIFYTQSIYIE